MDEYYKILGIDKNATDEEIKSAYIKLKRKYDPDSYDKDFLKEHAKQKVEQITNAFDNIMNDKRAKRMKTSGTAKQENKKDELDDLKIVQDLIQEGNFQKAQDLLENISSEKKGAHWYYLKGIILFKKGWLMDSINFFETAVRMDPTNEDYKKALQKANWQKNGGFNQPNYNPYDRGYPCSGPVSCGFCDICSGIMCADMCCDCAVPRDAGRCC